MTSPDDADHGIDLDDLKRVLAEHKQRHARQEYPFCEDFGCMDVEPLVAELECLRQRESELRDLVADSFSFGALAPDWYIEKARAALDPNVSGPPVDAQQVTVMASASSWAGGWNEDAVDDE